MPKVIEIHADPAWKGMRLDQALALRFPDSSRSILQNLIKTGGITVDGTQVKAGYKVKGPEHLKITLPDPEVVKMIAPTALSFDILFEDEHLIAINKPAGLTTHPGAGREKDSVVAAVLSHTPLSPTGAPLRPGVVQRLDKATTGAMVLAKTEECHKKLARLFAKHALTKEYLAIVVGQVKEDAGNIEVAIERDRVQRKRMKATFSSRGRMAKSSFQVVERFPGATLVRVAIETGRTHQIRVHLAFIGHPLLGDSLYGGRKFFGKPLHFLHSERLFLTHPMTRRKLELIAPMPPEFTEALTQLREGNAGNSGNTAPGRHGLMGRIRRKL